MAIEGKWKEIAITLLLILAIYFVLNVTLPYLMADFHAGILNFFSPALTTLPPPPL